MKPPPFGYLRPASLEEAVAALVEHGDEAKLLAGGQSLIPMLNFRLARPGLLVDLERVPGLDELSWVPSGLTIGAMARQAAVLRDRLVRERLPLLAEALRHVGHHQIRTRGTIGGSLAHADPAAELPAIALLLDARLETQGPGGRRSIPAASFWQAPFTTDLRDDEVLLSVHVPIDGIEAWSFQELARRGGDFAMAGVAAARIGGSVRLVGFGLGWTPVRLADAERAHATASTPEAAIDAAVLAAAREVDPISDVHAAAAYRREAVGTLVGRALRALAA